MSASLRWVKTGRFNYRADTRDDGAYLVDRWFGQWVISYLPPNFPETGQREPVPWSRVSNHTLPVAQENCQRHLDRKLVIR